MNNNLCTIFVHIYRILCPGIYCFPSKNVEFKKTAWGDRETHETEVKSKENQGPVSLSLSGRTSQAGGNAGFGGEGNY